MKFRFSSVIPATFILMTIFSSCTKDFVCQCSIKYSGLPGLPDSVIKEYPIKDKKKNAKSVCESNSGTYTNGEIVTEEKCHLY